MRTVWSALRSGGVPAKRPLTQPNTASAVSVTRTDHGKALRVLAVSM